MTQFDPKQLERGLVCTPGELPTIIAAIITVKKIPYYKGEVSSKGKFHITVGHETVMCKVTLFGDQNIVDPVKQESDSFNFNRDYFYLDNLISDLKSEQNKEPVVEQFALLEFEKHVTCAKDSLLIGSRLDSDIHLNTCRLAFHGHLLEAITDEKYRITVLPKLRVFKNKCREGVVERRHDDYTVICRGLFKKETKVELFTGLKVELSTGEQGVIESGFGQSGKFKVRLPGMWKQTCTELASHLGCVVLYCNLIQSSSS